MRGDDGWRPLSGPAQGHPVNLGASPFGRLAVAHALTVAGDALITIALAGSLFFDISPNAARGRVTLSLVLSMAPFAVVAPFLGPAVDRVRGGRRFMMAAVALARAVTCLFMAGVLNQLWLFPAAFAALVLGKTHSVTKSSLVPSVVSSEEGLVEANAKLALSGVVVGLLAAAPGVAILKLAGAEWVVRVAGVVFLLAAVAATRIVTVRADGRESGEAPAVPVSDAGIATAGVAMGALRASVGFLTFLLAFALRRDGAPSWVFGAALLASMVGSFVGSVTAGPLRRAMSEERLLTAALGVLGVGGLVATFVSDRVGAALLAAVVGLAAGGGKLAFDSLVQRDAPHAVRGRSFARFEALFQLAWVGGALLPVVLPIPLTGGFYVLAAVGLVCAGGYGMQQR
ncbi:MAG TPA: MFS transporter [Acidimicrobiales bacterium]|nr:MFS transporter [Acidimicrobiales bacterium]